MVLQQTHSTRYGAQPARLDANRILGISSTLALNLLALAMLLAPMTMPAPAPRAVPVPGLEIVPIVPVERRPTPPPPDVVPVTPPRIQPPAVTHQQVIAPPSMDVPLLADQGEFIAAVPEPSADAGAAATIEPPGPPTGMQLQYAHAPSPAYPPPAVRRGLEGVVLLRVLVDVDGRPLEVQVERSSGHAVLDREAQRHVRRHWRFQPALRDGQPVQAVGLVPVDFRLDRH